MQKPTLPNDGTEGGLPPGAPNSHKTSGIYSGEELLALAERQRSERIRRGWGRWRFDRKCDCLWYAKPGQREEDAYWIPLHDIRDQEHFYQWLMHLMEKRWVTPADIGDFCRAIDDLKSLRAMGRHG